MTECERGEADNPDDCGCCDCVPGGWDYEGFAGEGEMERGEARGTSECDGACVPMCRWCLLAHNCPDDCGGGDDCPYAEHCAR